jgi:FkbM family methyltransferase
VVAVEPHPDNVALLRANLGGLDADIRHAAVGRTGGETRIVNPDASEWAFRTGEADAEGAGPLVPVITIPNLVREKAAQGMVPLILKCDIEGAEADLFDADSDWFDAFAMVSVEPHDWMLPDQLTANGFLRAHLRTPRSLLLQGENLVSVLVGPPTKQPRTRT